MTVGDHLGHEGVEGTVDARALDEMGVHAHAWTGGQRQVAHDTVRRQHLTTRPDPLGGDPQLDGSAAHLRRAPQTELGQRLTCSQT